jgi:hypothetical protein
MAKRAKSKTLRARAEAITADLLEAEGPQDMALILAAHVVAIEDRIAALEASPLDYRGVWEPGTYPPRSITSHGGSMWFTGEETKAKPGEGTPWKLAVKKGRDGKDKP